MSNDVVISSQALGTLAAQTQTCSYPANISLERLYDDLALLDDHPSIRLLDLEPPTSGKQDLSDSAPLKGKLRVVRLQESLSFVALSYVWGEHTTTANSVYLEEQNCRVPLTYNCHAALHQIRRRFGAVTVWVDSICINQANEADKSKQIPLMLEIYSWARTVYVWLGDGDESSDRAMRYLRRAAACTTRLPFKFAAASLTRPGDEKCQLLRFNKEAMKDPIRMYTSTLTLFQYLFYYFVVLWSEAYDYIGRFAIATGFAAHRVDLCNILDREWIHRAWTLQEMVLASNPVILCGEELLLWEDLILAIYAPDKTLWRGRNWDALPRQRFTAALARWQSIMDLWLNLPRANLDRTTNVQNSLDKCSLTEHLATLDDKKETPRTARALSLISLSLYNLLQVSYFAMSIYVTYVAVISAKANLKLTDGTQFYALWLICFSALLGHLCFYSWVNKVLSFLRWIIGGQSPDWFLKETRSKNLQVLGAIQVALRERTCTEPQDRAFALIGILKSFGATPSPAILYSPTSETYQCFLKDLLDWDSNAVAMIADAGFAPAGWPSWVPQWGSTPTSSWLTWRYVVGSPVHAAPAVPKPYYKITNSRLQLKGKCQGSITFITHFENIGRGSGYSQIISNLERFLSWLSATRDCQLIYGDGEMEGSLFAILYGLTPERGPTHEVVGTICDTDQFPEIHTDFQRLPLWQGPYDFTAQRSAYEEFYRLYKMIKASLPPSTGDTDQTSREKSEQIDIIALANVVLPTDEYHRCFVRIINAVASQSRCVFVLEDGSIGTGPANLQIGDQAFLLGGVPVPMILSKDKVKDAFKVRSAAIVHGIMHGSGFSSKQQEDVTLI